MIPRLLPFLLVALAAVSRLAGAPTDRIAVDAMKTSIYVGSVTLDLGELQREGDAYRTTYSANVFPWFFWNETGSIRIVVSDADLARLDRGERVEFTGDATNHKGKPRRISGRADRQGASGGRIKVRVDVGDVELIFNGDFRYAG